MSQTSRFTPLTSGPSAFPPCLVQADSFRPAGRRMEGTLRLITKEHPYKLMLFDFATQKWTEVFGSEMGYRGWSHDGKYIYFQDMARSCAGHS